MNPDILRHEDFRALASQLASAPHDNTTRGALADLIGEHIGDPDHPHADMIRRALPIHSMVHTEHGSQFDPFLDVGGGTMGYIDATGPHNLIGRYIPGRYNERDEPIASHTHGPETHDLFYAPHISDVKDGHAPVDNYGLRYTLRLPGKTLRTVTPMSREKLADFIHATGLADNWRDHLPYKLMRPQSLNDPRFWTFAHGLTQEPHDERTAARMANLLDTHDSPIRSAFFRSASVDPKQGRYLRGKAIASGDLPTGETLGLHRLGDVYAVHYHLHHGAANVHRLRAVTPDEARSIAATLPPHAQAAWHAALEPHTKLARLKAPAGGAIVNNQFVSGGRFIPRVFARLRDVAAALRVDTRTNVRQRPAAQLARSRLNPRSSDDLHALLHIAKNNQDDTAIHGALADKIREVTSNPSDPRALVVQLHGQQHAAQKGVRAQEYHNGGLDWRHTRIHTSKPAYSTSHKLLTGLQLHEYARADDDLETLPVASWTVPIPGLHKRASGAYHVFRAALTPEQVRDVVDNVPARHRARLRAYATARGWLGAEKLSRSYDNRAQARLARRPIDPRTNDTFRHLLHEVVKPRWRVAPPDSKASYRLDPPDIAAHHALADLIREITGNPDDPRALVVQLHGEQGGKEPWSGAFAPTTPAYATGHKGTNGLWLAAPRNLNGEGWRPVVRWRVPVPPLNGNRIAKANYHTFSAAITPGQVHSIADMLPPDNKREWKELAERQGWHAETPEKMARAPQTAYAFVSPSLAQHGTIADAVQALPSTSELQEHARYLPGVQRVIPAVGVSTRGAQPSVIVHGDPGSIASIAETLGGDTSSLGIENKTIVPGTRSTAYVVDLGDEARERLAGYAVSRGAEHTVDAGHAVLRFLHPEKLARPSDTPSMLEQLRQHAQAAVNTSNPKKAGIHRTIADMLHTRLAKQGITAPHPSTFVRE